MRDHAIQGQALAFVYEQAVIEHLPQKAATLRNAEHIGIVEGVGTRIARLRGTVLEERHGIAYGSKAQAHQPTAARGIDQLINPPGLKASVQLHVVRCRIAIELYERPRIARDRGRRRIGVIPHLEHGAGLV